MGHYYTGRPVGGTVTLALAGGAIAAGLLFRNVTTLCLDDVPAGGTCPSGFVVDEITEHPYLVPAIGVAAAVTVISAIEALVKAKRRRAAVEAIRDPAQSATRSTLRGPSASVRGSRVDLKLLRVAFF
jgi:hypothetical protein